jgi:hypothetical protein
MLAIGVPPDGHRREKDNERQKRSSAGPANWGGKPQAFLSYANRASPFFLKHSIFIYDL